MWIDLICAVGPGPIIVVPHTLTTVIGHQQQTV